MHLNMLIMRYFFYVLIYILGVSLIVGCKIEPPAILKVTAIPQRIKIGEIITLKCIAENNNERYGYHWSSNGGEFVDGNTEKNERWVSKSEPGEFTIKVIVIGYDKTWAMDSVKVNVEPSTE